MKEASKDAIFLIFPAAMRIVSAAEGWVFAADVANMPIEAHRQSIMIFSCFICLKTILRS